MPETVEPKRKTPAGQKTVRMKTSQAGYLTKPVFDKNGRPAMDSNGKPKVELGATFVRESGREYTMPLDEADRLIEAQQAEEV